LGFRLVEERFSQPVETGHCDLFQPYTRSLPFNGLLESLFSLS
jgi:hypothetical protein